MSDEELEASLVTKLASLQNGGVDGYIVTNSAFMRNDHTLARLASRPGIGSPVKIGLAGPTSLMTWLNLHANAA